MKTLEHLQVGEIFALIRAAQRVSAAKKTYQDATTAIAEGRFDGTIRFRSFDDIVDEERHAKEDLIALAETTF